jgi:hypothetical protein
MEIKFEQTIVALLAIQVILLFMTYSIVSDYIEEDEDKDKTYYQDSCSCYCDYPYYYGYDDVYIAEGDSDRASEDNTTSDNNTEEE